MAKLAKHCNLVKELTLIYTMFREVNFKIKKDKREKNTDLIRSAYNKARREFDTLLGGLDEVSQFLDTLPEPLLNALNMNTSIDMEIQGSLSKYVHYM